MYLLRNHENVEYPKIFAFPEFWGGKLKRNLTVNIDFFFYAELIFDCRAPVVSDR